MARYKVRGPDGAVHVFEGPDDATPDQVTAAAQAQFGGPAPQAPERGFIDGAKQTLGNLAAGAVRGAGSIGATLLAPVDAAARAVGVQNDYIGRTDRRESMDAALGGLGAETDSLAYGAGKLGAEIAGTAGVGGTLARVAQMARAAPNLVNAIRTAGFSGGNLGTRAAGGAITGAASAGLVNPGDADTGAAVGAVLPGALKVAGAAGNAVGRTLSGPAQTPDLQAAILQARQAGYVIPPTQAKPTLTNRLLEGLSGKITTAQNASAKNQTVTNGLVADALGLPKDTKLSLDVLDGVRRNAGNAYAAIGNTGMIQPGPAYTQSLDAIAAPFVKAMQGFPNAKPSPVLGLLDELRTPQFDAASAVEKIKQLRTAADDAFRKGDTDIARASRKASEALESAIDDHLTQIGNPQLLQEFRDARTLIAKTYSAQKALNPTTGSIDARKLAQQKNKGKMLTGGLNEAADFAGRFPKAAQSVEGMGSLPQTSPLDWAAGAGLGIGTGNPLAALAVGARPLTRAAILSGPVQNRLIQGQPNRLSALLSSPEAQALAYRSAPVIAADR